MGAGVLDQKVSQSPSSLALDLAAAGGVFVTGVAGCAGVVLVAGSRASWVRCTWLASGVRWPGPLICAGAFGGTRACVVLVWTRLLALSPAPSLNTATVLTSSCA